MTVSVDLPIEGEHVERYGADPSGVADSTAAFQAAMLAAGKGTVVCGVGTYVLDGFELNSGVTLVGQGRDSTVLRLMDGATSPVIDTPNWSTLTGSDAADGIGEFQLQSLRVDGNYANCLSSPAAVRLYGANYRINDVTIHDSAGIGLHTEFGSGYWDVGGTHYGVEANIDHLMLVNNDGGNWFHDGPHDCKVEMLTSIYLPGYNRAQATHYVMTPKAGGTRMHRSHMWGAGNNGSGQPEYCADIQGPGYFATMCNYEGASSANIRLRSGRNGLANCTMGLTGGSNLLVDSGGAAVGGNMVTNCEMRSAVAAHLNLVTDGDIGSVYEFLHDSSAPEMIGTASNQSTVNGVRRPVWKNVSYTLSGSDAGGVVEFQTGSALTLSVPAHASVPFVRGSAVDVTVRGPGSVTLAVGAGVQTVPAALLPTISEGQWLRLVNTEADRWYVLVT